MRKGLTQTMTIVVAAVASLILLGSTQLLAGGMTSFMKGEVMEVQADRIINTGLILDSVPSGEMEIDVTGYALRYDGSSGEIGVKYGSKEITRSAEPLLEAYDSIQAPNNFQEPEGPIRLRKEVSGGEETLVLVTDGSRAGSDDGDESGSGGEGDAEPTYPPNLPGGGSEGSEESYRAIGGGATYDDKITQSQADYTVSNSGELQSALQQAEAGETVFVPEDERIEVGIEEFTVPKDVTLASNRGVDGSRAGLIDNVDEKWPVFKLRSNSRVTGLRIDGPKWEWMAGKQGDAPHYDDGMGLRVNGNNVEIDNNAITGFGHAAVGVFSSDAHVHHNNISHNPRGGLGYGVTVNAPNALIEYNYMNYNRHSIAGGAGEGGYEARYNVFGDDHISHVMDMHRPGGSTIEIHHNTVRDKERTKAHNSIETLDEPRMVQAVAIRGTPSDIASIHNNWFYNSIEPPNSADGWGPEAIIQAHTDDWQNLEFENNHYGENQPESCDIGAPREGCQ